MFRMFGVSRLVVREVMRTLAAKGMVTSKVRVGTRVSAPTQWAWLDPQVLSWRSALGLDQAFLTQLTQVRLALEPAAASLAAENRNEQDIATMQAALDEMYASEDDQQAFSKADKRFHDAIIAATHNPFFYASSSSMEVTLSRILSAVALSVPPREGTLIGSAVQHKRILQAIIARKPKAAAQAMILVIKDGLKYGQRLLATNPAIAGA